ncbi:uncharacterized protein EV420DRAFT_1638668 [Desarmillaria tabescens]|uniref:Uncharacterized protein n=1 Tax=Armillaria tabescens TaxID=1929756 RepID=A0AA39NDP4_ARMTA|nr:uncharacterized protein EV420DRAFT_1638668 [Desarmillaria tabescens]KAK0463747.1 hypothetical protein EV420DRAFT_1638668 [Desarmillaria tabescens]
MYHVFLGTPSSQELHGRQSEYRWERIGPLPGPAVLDAHVPPTSAALEAATNHRISHLYENTIFRGDEQLDDEYESTMITWPPTNSADSKERLQTSTTSFLETSALLLETQEMQETHYSDTSSIARFPSPVSKSYRPFRSMDGIDIETWRYVPDSIKVMQLSDSSQDGSLMG